MSNQNRSKSPNADLVTNFEIGKRSLPFEFGPRRKLETTMEIP